MDADWITSPPGQRIIALWADRRPAWLWSADGTSLIWHNGAAQLFGAKIKKSGLKRYPLAVPIKGQIARLLRLGTIGRSSLSRLQFLAGERPMSATCTVTPLDLGDGEIGMLVAAVDPIEPAIYDSAEVTTDRSLLEGREYLLLNEGGVVLERSSTLSDLPYPLRIDPAVLMEAGERIAVANRTARFTPFKAGPSQTLLLLQDVTTGVPQPTDTPEQGPAAQEPEPAAMELLPAAVEPEPASLSEAEAEPKPLEEPVAAVHWEEVTQPVEEPVSAVQPEEPEPAADPGPPEPEPVEEPMAAEQAVEALEPVEGPAPAGSEAVEEAELPWFEAPPAPEPELLAPAVTEQPVLLTPEPAQPASQPAMARPTLTPPLVTALDGSGGEVLDLVPPHQDRSEQEELPHEESARDELQQDETPPEEPKPEPSSSQGLTGAALESEHPSEPVEAEAGEKTKRLSALFDRLTDTEALFAPLGAGDDLAFATSQFPLEPQAPPAQPAEPVARERPKSPTPLPRPLFKVTGRGLSRRRENLARAPQPVPPDMEASIETTTALGSTGEPVRHPQQPSPPQGGRVLDAESVERVSRYNFDELSRILSDRVGENGFPGSRSGLDLAGRESQGLVRPAGSLVSLGGETLVLNRLPLGILVFRDQQVLFANRAITEMIGYESVEALRNAGLASVFPGSDGEAGPVNHLVQRDGTLIPVTARLQSISWQGRPALMLSASATEVRTGHEAAVGAFANLLAETRGDGFIETSRAGVLSGASAPAVALLGQPRERLIGKPLTEFIDPAGTEALKAYLERPARFAETARPHLALSGIDREVQILLFAQGQAGTITGHFGFVRRMEARTSQTSLPAEPGPDAALLGRISRGVRRPLNTVIGFADLVGSESFGPIGNQRYLEYARDIRSAGEEIAALIDELDDYTRLKDGRYQPAPSDVDLASLLETCIQRIRPQANAARVLVRSAISERLPHVMADKPSLAQGVLNLLASAIDQTPAAGSVVLSAQAEDDGGVVVHVRDGAAADADLGERFVVFRDGIGRNGVALAPIRSSVGLALTRSLLAVNSSTLSVNPAGGSGTLLSLRIPESLVIKSEDVPG